MMHVGGLNSSKGSLPCSNGAVTASAHLELSLRRYVKLCDENGGLPGGTARVGYPPGPGAVPRA